MTAHSDHPMRHWGRTCPACNPAPSSQASAPSEGGGNADTEVRASLSDHAVLSGVLQTALPEDPERGMATESYWQLGFNDGCAGMPCQLSRPVGPNETLDHLRAHGYCNGYDEGRSKRFAARQPEMMKNILASIPKE